MKHQRAFDRDEFIGLRCPRACKSRLRELARKKTRDVSSLALEFINEGLSRMERQVEQSDRGAAVGAR